MSSSIDGRSKQRERNGGSGWYREESSQVRNRRARMGSPPQGPKYVEANDSNLKEKQWFEGINCFRSSDAILITPQSNECMAAPNKKETEGKIKDSSKGRKSHITQEIIDTKLKADQWVEDTNRSQFSDAILITPQSNECMITPNKQKEAEVINKISTIIDQYNQQPVDEQMGALYKEDDYNSGNAHLVMILEEIGNINNIRTENNQQSLELEAREERPEPHLRTNYGSASPTTLDHMKNRWGVILLATRHIGTRVWC
jgi:hypothetical protein